MRDPDPGDEHELDVEQIDELDEISGDEQLVLIGCHTHDDWEWHWIPFAELASRHRLWRRRHPRSG